MSEGSPDSRWLRWFGVGAAVLLLVVVFVLRAQRSTAPDPDSSPPPGGEEPVALAPPPPLPGEDDDLPEAERRYLEATVYPPSSGRLTRDHQALVEPNRRYEGQRPIRETFGDDPSQVVVYEFSAERFDLTGDDEVEAWLEVSRAGEPLEVRIVEAQLHREGRAGREGDPIEVDFVWRDGRWVSELPIDELSDHHGFVVLEARFEYAPGEGHEDALRFFVTPEDRIPAHFTDSFHDYVRDGALHVEVGLDVETAGFFRIDANFYDASGEPVAFAVWKGELDEGRRSPALEVFGKVLRDVGSAGPYTIGELRGYRFIDGGFPDRETIPKSDRSWTTGRYGLAEFSEDPWDSEHKRRMLELMAEDRAAGIEVDLPGLPGPDRAEPASPLPPGDPAGG